MQTTDEILTGTNFSFKETNVFEKKNISCNSIFKFALTEQNDYLRAKSRSSVEVNFQLAAFLTSRHVIQEKHVSHKARHK